jgi:hypothetical protein
VLFPKASFLSGIGFKELLDAVHISTLRIVPLKGFFTPPFAIFPTATPASATFPMHAQLQAFPQGSVQRYPHTTQITQLF